MPLMPDGPHSNSTVAKSLSSILTVGFNRYHCLYLFMLLLQNPLLFYMYAVYISAFQHGMQKYSLLTKVADSLYGQVWKARHRETGQLFALKISQLTRYSGRSASQSFNAEVKGTTKIKCVPFTFAFFFFRVQCITQDIYKESQILVYPPLCILLHK